MPEAVMQEPLAEDAALLRRISRRLLPILFLSYAVSYMDFYNIAFAKLQMQDDLGLSDAAFGLGVSALVIGQLLFMVPSNLLLHRYGARATMVRVMLGWLLGSAAIALVSTANQFMLVRFLTGLATAGIFTGLVLYLTYWFPATYRARTMSVFMLAPVAAGIVVGPLSGALMIGLEGSSGLRGWQWMFLLEALPALIIAVLIPRLLVDRPDDAFWLDASERERIAALLAADHVASHQPRSASLGELAREPRIYLLGLFSAMVTFGMFSASFFLPTIIHDMGVDGAGRIGLLSSIPYCLGGGAMFWWSRHSDRTLERYWHCSAGLILAGSGFAVLAFMPGPVIGMGGLVMAVAGLLCAIPCFWPIPSQFLTGQAAAAGIAVIVVMGDLGGALAPPVIGHLRAQSGPSAALALAAAMLLCGPVVLRFATARASRPAGAGSSNPF